MKARVLEELARIEQQYDVRVLLAVESGSRAWGFASPDSDYDVRFVYVHPRDWYLSVFEQRDVIEEMLEGDLDVSGWELRKTLRLFAKCNLALNEWIGSPIVYREETAFKACLAALVPTYFNPIAGLHHYRRMAEHALVENLADGQIRIKKLFYVLRPLFACRWIVRTQSQPPTEFARLTAQNLVSDEERLWIQELLQLKAAAVEAQPIEFASERAAALRAEIESYRDAGLLVDVPTKTNSTGDLDGVLRAWTRSA